MLAEEDKVELFDSEGFNNYDYFQAIFRNLKNYTKYDTIIAFIREWIKKALL